MNEKYEKQVRKLGKAVSEAYAKWRKVADDYNILISKGPNDISQYWINWKIKLPQKSPLKKKVEI